jgi:hypothetical protein
MEMWCLTVKRRTLEELTQRALLSVVCLAGYRQHKLLQALLWQAVKLAVHLTLQQSLLVYLHLRTALAVVIGLWNRVGRKPSADRC